MNVKTWIPLVLAIVLGLVAALMARNVISRNRGTANDGSLVSIVTAAHDIEPGQKITADDLGAAKLPAASVPSGSFQNPADLVDRVSVVRLVKGQHVLENTLAPTGTAAGVQALIPDGMRAITVEVNEFSGVAGLLLPGSKVDIISVIRNGDNASAVARTVVQNVEVRAIGRVISSAGVQAATPADAGAPPAPMVNNVTLLVTPEQAEAIQLASVGGRPWLVLRNSKDTESVETDGTSIADLRGDAKKAFSEEPVETPIRLAGNDPFSDKGSGVETPAAESPRTRTVKFIRATKEEAMTVEVAPAPPAEWITTSADTAPAAGEGENK
jgi:pilus assembly protein CpaB